MMLVNSSFLSGVHAHIARFTNSYNTRDVAIRFNNPCILCFQPRTEFTMSRDPWCGLESATRFGWSESLTLQQMRISKGEFEELFLSS